MIVLVAGREVEDIEGGHTRYVRIHARAAAAAGFTPHLYSMVRPPGLVATDVGPLHRVPSPWPWTWQIFVPLHASRLAQAIEGFLADRPGPHVIHGFGLWGYPAVEAARRLGRRGIAARAVTSLYDTMVGQARAKLKGVVAAHGRGERVRRGLELAWSRLALGAYERRMFEGSRVLLVNYRSVARLYEDRYGPHPDLRRITYTTEGALQLAGPGPDPGLHPDLTRLGPAGAPLIMAVSRHDPRKGLDVLLQALHRLRKRGVSYRACLVGRGSLLPAHREMARGLGLLDRVAIVGWVADPEPYLRQADVFVLPSLAEGSGSLSLVEALRAGLPAVASACDGIPEDVTDGESALLVTPGRVDDLAAALGRVLADEPLRRHLARGAEAAFAARFSPAAFVGALRATYADLGAVAPAGPAPAALLELSAPGAPRRGKGTLGRGARTEW